MLAISEYKESGTEHPQRRQNLREDCETLALARESLEIGFTVSVRRSDEVDAIVQWHLDGYGHFGSDHLSQFS